MQWKLNKTGDIHRTFLPNFVSKSTTKNNVTYNSGTLNIYKIGTWEVSLDISKKSHSTKLTKIARKVTTKLPKA